MLKKREFYKMCRENKNCGMYIAYTNKWLEDQILKATNQARVEIAEAIKENGKRIVDEEAYDEYFFRLFEKVRVNRACDEEGNPWTDEYVTCELDFWEDDFEQKGIICNDRS